MKHRITTLENRILGILSKQGYDAMVVGGAVRDFLLNKDFNDIDITTNAPYTTLTHIMEGVAELKLVGSAFNVLLVGGVEVATYRTETCEDNKVLNLETASTAYEDSTRRDFTINAIYYNYTKDEFHDYHNGITDLNNKVIRTVGSPYERFNEDYSRILRALYLSANLDFTIEEETGKAIRELGHKITEIPNALQGKIIKKVIHAGCFYGFLKLLKEYDLLKHLFPEMVHTINLEQNPKYHKYDVWTHTLEVVKTAEMMHQGDTSFIMGAFLHDVAKGKRGIRSVSPSGQPNDLGHEEAGVPIAKGICQRLELGKAITNEVVMYVKWHGVRMATTEKSVKHFLFKYKDEFRNLSELQNNFLSLLEFMICDAHSFSDDFSKSMLDTLTALRPLATNVFNKQIFYSHQFNFNASVIAKHPNVKSENIKEWIEFFIRNNITDEASVIKILDKQPSVK